MKIFFLPYVLVLVAILTYFLKNGAKKSKKVSEDFWEVEHKADLTFRKNIDNLNYITIPIDSLPFFEINDEIITNCQKTIKNLSEQKIVNFTGLSNTDLKLKYGRGNLTVLSEYDNNFTKLVSTFDKWAKRLFELNYSKDAAAVLEFSISSGSDISSSYYMLAEYYQAEGRFEEIGKLLLYASSIHSLTKDIIIKKLTQMQN